MAKGIPSESTTISPQNGNLANPPPFSLPFCGGGEREDGKLCGRGRKREEEEEEERGTFRSVSAAGGGGRRLKGPGGTS